MVEAMRAVKSAVITDNSNVSLRIYHEANPPNKENTAPHIAPSIVLLGLTCGASLCFPINFPPNNAKASHNHVAKHAVADVIFQLSCINTQITKAKRSIG